MPGDSTCKKCSQRIDHKDQLFVVCEGDCASFFHMDCAKLSEKELTVLSTNFIWLCDACLDQFQRARDDRSRNGIGSDLPKDMGNGEASRKSLENEIIQLKPAVAGIIETLAKHAPTASTTEPSLRHSTPLSSHVLLDGTNACSFTGNNNECFENQRVVDEGDFSLLLTNIDVSADYRDVHRMVVEALGIGSSEQIDIVKLVSPWKRQRTMDYVSFRIVLNDRWKCKAMNPATWPKGLKFREFIKRHLDTWKPVF